MRESFVEAWTPHCRSSQMRTSTTCFSGLSQTVTTPTTMCGLMLTLSMSVTILRGIGLTDNLRASKLHNTNLAIFSARQRICYSALYAVARPSVRLSVRQTGGSKTVEVRIMQPLPQSSPMTLVFWRLTLPRNSKGNIGSGGAEWQRGRKNTQFSANKSPYLRNGAR